MLLVHGYYIIGYKERIDRTSLLQTWTLNSSKSKNKPVFTTVYVQSPCAPMWCHSLLKNKEIKFNLWIVICGFLLDKTVESEWTHVVNLCLLENYEELQSFSRWYSLFSTWVPRNEPIVCWCLVSWTGIWNIPSSAHFSQGWHSQSHKWTYNGGYFRKSRSSCVYRCAPWGGLSMVNKTRELKYSLSRWD